MDTLKSVGLRHQLLYIFSVVRIRNSAQEEIRADIGDPHRCWAVRRRQTTLECASQVCATSIPLIVGQHVALLRVGMSGPGAWNVIGE